MNVARFASRVFVVCLVALVPVVVAGQPAVATLAGRVVDTQLAVTPGASVTVRSHATSTTWTARTDER